MKTKEYELIPLTEITDEAREIAVAWIDNFQKIGGMEIQQKHKLASDIMNYAKEYATQSRWIPVSEHKPDVECAVLVSIVTENPDFRGRSIAEIDSDGRWWRNYVQLTGVTHWQELPENP